MINLAIIGMGQMGAKYAKMLYENKDLGYKITAITRVKGKNLELVKDYLDGVLIYESDELLFEGFDRNEFLCDAVLIVTPHMRHEYDAIMAFKRNLSVLCDKPAGARLSEGRRMYEAIENNTFGFVFQQRYFPVYEKLKEIIENKTYGRIKRYQATITDWYRTNQYYKSAHWRATYKTDGGGVLLNQCPHTLDILYYLFGMPQKIRAFCECGKYHDIEVEDEVHATMIYQNGMIGSFITSTGELPGTNKIEIAFDRAYLHVYKDHIDIYENEHNEEYYRNLEDYKTPTPKISRLDFDVSQTYDLIFKNFKSAFEGNEKIKISGYEAMMSLYMANAMYLSTWLDKDINIYQVGSKEELEFENIYDIELNKRIK